MSINVIGPSTGSSYSFGVISSSSRLLFTSGIVSISADGEVIAPQVFDKPFPASSTVGVSKLVKPGLLVEIEAIATV